MHLRIIILAITLALPGASMALDLKFTGFSSITGEVLRDPDSYQLPIGPYENGALPVQNVEGSVLQRAWRIEAQGLTTLQLIRNIREQLESVGFEITFECAGLDCGGFDFRFNTKVMPAPNMYVDLFDFRYLVGLRAGPEYVSVIASQAGGAGYVQVVHVTPEGTEVPDVAIETPPTVTKPETSVIEPEANVLLVESLQTLGHVNLRDLEFKSGSATLGPGPFATLKTLAAYLLSDNTRRVALVGHTDTVGALDNNIALSKRRAQSVLDRLVTEYDVPAEQLEAEGMGYLAPLGPNLTQEGREANRRVEAVLLNTE